MREYLIEQSFSGRENLIFTIINNFTRTGRVIHGNRNIVKYVESPLGPLVIKYFKGMYFLNRLSYSIFRPSKAERSFKFSRRLHELGINTPLHVAYVDEYKYGFLTDSYFVSLFEPHKNLNQVIDNQMYNLDEVYKALARFTMKLHQNNVLHQDYSAGNILVHPKGDTFDFSMVDLNRIKFTKVNYWQGVSNFAKLTIAHSEIEKIVREYAMLHQQSPDDAVRYLNAHIERLHKQRVFRRTIKSVTLKPLEKLLFKR